MKTAALILTFLFVPLSAHALCTGGFDGTLGKEVLCSELGTLGDLQYDRDANGTVKQKRSDAQIKTYVVQFVKDRFKNRGLKLDEGNVRVNDKTVDFDLYDLNGEKVYSFSLDKASGIPANEKILQESRESVDARRSAERSALLNDIKRLKQRQSDLSSKKGKK
ncbi:MAG TPA: hypothetical protein DD624_04990 [Alphaproteobacteria bacterium]|nr:hypothetical protein [Alphaproteobacteria bacterium]